MSVLSLSYWESDVYWRQNNKHFAELAPQNGGKQLIWRNYVTVTLCLRRLVDRCPLTSLCRAPIPLCMCRPMVSTSVECLPQRANARGRKDQDYCHTNYRNLNEHSSVWQVSSCMVSMERYSQPPEARIWGAFSDIPGGVSSPILSFFPQRSCKPPDAWKVFYKLWAWGQGAILSCVWWTSDVSRLYTVSRKTSHLWLVQLWHSWTDFDVFWQKCYR